MVYEWVQSHPFLTTDELVADGVPMSGSVANFESTLTNPGGGGAATVAPAVGYTAAFVVGSVNEVTHVSAPGTIFRIGQAANYAIEAPVPPAVATRQLRVRSNPDQASVAGQVITTKMTVLEGP